MVTKQDLENAKKYKYGIRSKCKFLMWERTKNNKLGKYVYYIEGEKPNCLTCTSNKSFCYSMFYSTTPEVLYAKLNKNLATPIKKEALIIVSL